MDVAQSDFEFLKSSVLRASADLRLTLSAADLGEPVRGVYVLRHALAALVEVDASVRRLDALPEASESASLDHRTKAMRFLADQVRAVHAAAPWVEALRARSLPLGLVYFVEEAAVALGLDVDVLLNPDPIYMYSADVEPFRGWVSPVANEPRPIIISFPSREAPSLFLNALFVHELAHVAVEEGGMIDRVVDSHSDLLKPENEQYKTAIDWYVAGRLGELGGELGGDALETARDQFAKDGADVLRALIDAWLEEFLCDALASGYLGPSYLFACADFLYSASVVSTARAHPPETLRLKLVLSSPEQAEWALLLNERAGRTIEWLSAVGDREWEGDPFEILAGGFAIAAASTIHAAAVERLQHSIFSPDAFAGVQDELLELLDYGILPVQLDHLLPVPAPPILLAGWLHEFAKKGDAPATVARALTNRRLQAFLTKAIEMSALASRWHTTGTRDASAS